MTRAWTESSRTAAIAGITPPGAKASGAATNAVCTASGRPTGGGGELSCRSFESRKIPITQP